MNDLLKIWEKPSAKKNIMIAGWRQWADAGDISSGLPQYLIDTTGARKIGEIDPYGFYLFQIPGTHHFLRPEIKLEEGYRKELERKKNEFYYTGDDEKGLVIFLGDEPHLSIERYAQTLLFGVKELGIDRVAAVGGVHGPVPHDKAREVSCVYSMPGMKQELDDYGVRFSDYEGGTTIGTYLVDQAEKDEIEFLVLYAFVPAYDFSELSSNPQVMRVETDYKAWYDVMRRLSHMFELDYDLSDLETKSEKLLSSINDKIYSLEKSMPQLNIQAYLKEISKDFIERPFLPLSDVWEAGLKDILDDIQDLE